MFPRAILVLLLSALHFIVGDSALDARTGCGMSYTLCSPKSASTQDEPLVGSALSSFFVNIVNTVDSNPNHKREVRGATQLSLEPQQGACAVSNCLSKQHDDSY